MLRNILKNAVVGMLVVVLGVSTVVAQVSPLHPCAISDKMVMIADSYPAAIASGNATLIFREIRDRLDRLATVVEDAAKSFPGTWDSIHNTARTGVYSWPYSRAAYGNLLTVFKDQVEALKGKLGCKPFFLRGDFNGIDGVNQVDAIDIYLWLNGQEISIGGEPGCLKAGDVNDDGAVDVTDVIVLMSFLYSGGQPPKPPFPSHGTDATGDSLSCETQPDALEGV